MRFVKMHGIGNDYVYVDCFNQPTPADPAALSRVVSDRHFGIGGDGLILVCRSDKADARMRMFNADGSEAEMCGNGIRCTAKLAYDHGLVRSNPLTIETGRGVLTLHLEVQDGKVSRVTVDMGEPILQAGLIPTTLPGPRVIDQPLPLRGEDLENWFGGCGLDQRITCVSMGNPHLVLYCRAVEKVPLEKVGPVLETLPCFPRRINVHFVQVVSPGPEGGTRDRPGPEGATRDRPGEVVMRTWERGSGITLACGTGACAVAVAGVLTGRTGPELLAHLPGGDLQLRWDGEGKSVLMTGPAVEVFSGNW